MIALSGCGMLQKPRLYYLGDYRQASEASLPAGFSISPSEAVDIAQLEHGRRKVAGYIYRDDKNYYACEFERFFESTRARAREEGTVISGTTGEVYNRELGFWDTDPRTEENAEPGSCVPIERKRDAVIQATRSEGRTTSER